MKKKSAPTMVDRIIARRRLERAAPEQHTALIVLVEASQLAVSALLGDDPYSGRMVEKFNRAIDLARAAIAKAGAA